MPSNSMYACTDCRIGGKNPYPACVAAEHNIVFLGSKISVPKKNNDRAWRRIIDGDKKWNHRKSRRRNTRETITKVVTRRVPIDPEPVDCDHYWCNNRPGRFYRTEVIDRKEVINYNRSPDVDLGG